MRLWLRQPIWLAVAWIFIAAALIVFILWKIYERDGGWAVVSAVVVIIGLWSYLVQRYKIKDLEAELYAKSERARHWEREADELRGDKEKAERNFERLQASIDEVIRRQREDKDRK